MSRNHLANVSAFQALYLKIIWGFLLFFNSSKGQTTTNQGQGSRGTETLTPSMLEQYQEGAKDWEPR